MRRKLGFLRLRNIAMNATSKTIRIRDIGDVVLERSRRAKHINISMRPQRGIRVAVPLGLSFENAEKFARSKTEWMKKHLEHIRVIENNPQHPVVEQVYVKFAKEQIIVRLNELADKHGFTYSKVTIRHQKSRWGSCSVRNNISLNISIARLPDKLWDYVILHELVHTRIKNHSKSFWNELDKYVGNAKAADAELKSCFIKMIS